MGRDPSSAVRWFSSLETDGTHVTAIALVGAGAAGAATAFAVARHAPDTSITVFEKSGGLSGRAATRHRDGLTYDYGANYVKSADERVAELLTEILDDDGLVDVAEPVAVFDESGTVSPGDDRDDHKWTYRAGIDHIGERLLAETEATVHPETTVTSLARDGDVWHLEDATGERWGPFDVVVLTPPAPQTADLLAQTTWQSPIRERLVDALQAVEFRTIWTAVLHYPFTLDRPYYALVNTDKNHDIGWLSREECKPGHVPDGESLLIVQASHDWSVAHADDPPAENVAQLADLTADLLDDERLADPDWTDHQRWRYAQPEAAVDTGPLGEAEDAGLFCAGDWVAGEARVHAAISNGLDVGERIAESVGERS
jgi:predicted NAD/FAD-dependent oxidoreductase